MADAARKAVESALMDTWSRGDSLLQLITDKGPVVRGGDSVDMPYKTGFTVNTSETANALDTTIAVDTLTVNRPKFINQRITKAQYAQLLNGDGNFASEMARGGGADLMNAIERDTIEYLLAEIVGADILNIANIDGGAVTDDDVGAIEARIREQDGIANRRDGLFWLLSPRAQAAIKTVTEYIPTSPDAQQGRMGIPLIATVNGIPAYLHNGMPGQLNATRQQVAASATSVTTNVCTATVPTGHGFFAGMPIFTTGMTANVAVGSPATISSVTSTTIVYPLTTGNGSNGTGTIFAASAMALLCYAPWIAYALDGLQPDVSLVERTDAAGWVLKLFHHFGRRAHAGAAMALHCPDGI